MTNNNSDLVTITDIVREALTVRRDIDGLYWREIANLDEYKGIPPGTLCSIYKGKPIPKRWYKRFGIHEMKPAPACPDCGEVHTKKTCPRTRNGKSQHYTVSIGFVDEKDRARYKEMTPEQRRKALDFYYSSHIKGSYHDVDDYYKD